MKTTLNLLLAASLATGISNAAEEAATNTPPVAGSAAVVLETTAHAVVPDAVHTNNVVTTNGNGGLRLNFRNVSLDAVLNYLSDAAGFIIVLDAQPRGKVDVWSNQPLTKEEAVDLLNTVLHKNGLAAVRNGRTLTIVNRDEAKTKSIRVVSGSNPDDIPKNDEIVTQIMPVRYVEVVQLLKDLQPLLSSQTTISANEAGNSIVITDTQANIHRVAEIIKAIDTGAEDVTEVRVFKLQFADPTEMATLLTSAFPDETRSSNSGSQSPFQFGGRRGGGGFPFGGGGGGDSSSSSQSQRNKKRTKVTAVPDARTASVIVAATGGLMEQIAEMITQLDSNPAKKQNVYVFSLQNADPQQVEEVLQSMFQSSNNRNNNRNSQQNNALQNRANQNQTSGNNSGSTFGGGGGNRTGGNRGGGF